MEERDAFSAQSPAPLTPGAIAQVLRSTAVMLQAETVLAWHPAPRRLGHDPPAPRVQWDGER